MLELLQAIPGGLYVLIGTVLGGIGLKILEHWFNKPERMLTEKASYRDEISELRDRLDKVEAEVDEWRDRYHANEDYINILRAFMYGKGLEPPQRQDVPKKHM